MKRKYPIIFFSLLLGNFSFLYAATLEFSLQEVLKTNPSIITKRKELNVAQHELELAKSGYYPTLNVQGSYGVEQAQSQLTQYEKKDWSTWNTGATLTQNLFSGFATDYDVKTKKYKVKAREFALQEQANDLALTTIKSYLDLIRSYELLLVDIENVKLHEKFFNDVRARTKGGGGRISDFMEVSAKLALASSNLLAQDNNYQDILANFHKVLGRYEEGKNLVCPSEVKDLPSTLDISLEEALKSNPSILVSRYEIEAAKTAMRLEYSEYMPSIDAAMKTNTSENASGMGGKNESYSALLTLSWNLYNGGASDVKVKKAISEIEIATEKLHTIQREVMENMGLSYNAYVSLKRQKEFLAIYEEVSSQKKQYYLEEFDLGRRTLIDILDTEDEYITAKRKSIQNKYDLLYAQYRILDAKGTLLSHFNIDIAGSLKREYNYKSENVEQDHVTAICQNSSDIAFGVYGCESIPKYASYEFLKLNLAIDLNKSTEPNSTDVLHSTHEASVTPPSEPTPPLKQPPESISACENHPKYTQAMEYLQNNVSHDKAFELLTQAAEEGNVKSQFVLARMYNQGSGVAIDKNKAAYWYIKSAEAGYTPSYLIVWSYYRDGRCGIQKDALKAEHWRKKAVEARKSGLEFESDACAAVVQLPEIPSAVQKKRVPMDASFKVEPLEQRLRELGISLEREILTTEKSKILDMPIPQVDGTIESDTRINND
ncbi:TolC family outer membrane protein [Sulfurimonas sp.]|uniref:TolC family outer membrane protein n=1 Tax=Sulfurimonas sp. TaxID=2022749 RepID=UPI00261ADC86|nr:TolC family outer membrane protein [Sulfurimonas sp.]MDD3451049.1 TolC family outer membrane protein [Sulfurimonas sp.]